MVTRRNFIGGAAALPCGAMFLAPFSFAAGKPTTLVAAARHRDRDGGVVWRDATTEPLALPARGHGLARFPNSERIIITGRRPGEFATIFDAANPSGPALSIHPAEGCRFSGHSAVAPAGATFATSEFEAQTMRGVLVIRDALNGVERDRFDPAGIEPHDMLFAGNRLIAALGGLIKDGGVAGPAPNIGGIDSSVVEIDTQSGKIVGRHKLAAEFDSLSLRHLALAPDGQKAIVGMQDQDLSDRRPLVAVIDIGKSIAPLPMPDAKEYDFRGYVGSVAIDASGEFAAATSPRGGVMGIWSLPARRWVAGLVVPDICGLAAGAAQGEFWASTGFGEVLKISADSRSAKIDARWNTKFGFDNHILRI